MIGQHKIPTEWGVITTTTVDFSKMEFAFYSTIVGHPAVAYKYLKYRFLRAMKFKTI